MEWKHAIRHRPTAQGASGDHAGIREFVASGVQCQETRRVWS